MEQNKSILVAVPFNLGSFVGNIIVSAIALVLFYAVILMRLDSIAHDPWWLKTINFLIVIAAGCVYFLPSIVAFDLKLIDDVLKGKKHRLRWLILLLNVFIGVVGTYYYFDSVVYSGISLGTIFGFTLIGWILLLIWSFKPGKVVEITVAQTDIVNSEKPPEKTIEEKLNELKNLLEKGLIDEAEFKSKKQILIEDL